MRISRTDYFQGILQLRDINEEIMNFVHNQLNKRKDVAVTKTVKLAKGIDLYITSQKYIKALGKKLKESFGGELKVSAKLHTRNKQGKDLYRVNVLFKHLKYKRGDVVYVRGEEVRLIRIGKKIFAKDMKTGKKLVIRSSDLSK